MDFWLLYMCLHQAKNIISFWIFYYNSPDNYLNKNYQKNVVKKILPKVCNLKKMSNNSPYTTYKIRSNFAWYQKYSNRTGFLNQVLSVTVVRVKNIFLLCISIIIKIIIIYFVYDSVSNQVCTYVSFGI